MANKTVDSDAAFKTYVEGLPAYASGTVYMNDDSKYWTFNKQASGKINAMCVNGDDIEVWVYDGTDWITNRIPEVVDNLTTDSAVAALSARQGKILDEKTNLFYEDYSNPVFTVPSGTPGLFVTSYDIDISVVNRVPISAMIYFSGHPATYFAEPVVTGNTLHVYIYRATTSSLSLAVGDLVVRVFYK